MFTYKQPVPHSAFLAWLPDVKELNVNNAIEQSTLGLSSIIQSHHHYCNFFCLQWSNALKCLVAIIDLKGSKAIELL